MTVTDKVKIGGQEYTVTQEEVVDEADSEANIDGQIRYSKCAIVLKATLPLDIDYTKMVFLHEILHGVFNHMQLRAKEDTVERLSRGLYEVIKDNPKIFKED